MRKCGENGRCPLCSEEEEDVSHVLLKCSATGEWLETILNNKNFWEEVTFLLSLHVIFKHLNLI
jgi:hypothetical protein